MEKFKTVESRPAPLDSSNVDTDQIIPKQFLKRIERTGFGQFLFFDWRIGRVLSGESTPLFFPKTSTRKLPRSIQIVLHGLQYFLKSFCNLQSNKGIKNKVS